MKIVEVAGAPKSGKTFATAIIERRAREIDWHVDHFHGGGRYIGMRAKGTVAFNLAVACRNVLNLLRTDELREGLLIMDRGPLDSLVFTLALEATGSIKKRDASLVREMVLSDEVLTRIDVAVFLSCSPEVALEREETATGRAASGVVNNPQRLTALHDATRQVADIATARGVSVLVVDTSADLRGTAQDAAARTLQMLTFNQ